MEKTKKKIEVLYWERKKGSSKWNPWGITQKSKIFDKQTEAKSFAKKIYKKTGYIPSLAWAYKTKKGYSSRVA